MRQPRWIFGVFLIIFPLFVWATTYTLTPPEPYVTGEGIGHENLMPPPGVKPTAQYHQGIYVEGYLGYTVFNWQAENAIVNSGERSNGGIIYGGDFGYHRRYFGLELGGYIFPHQVFNVSGVTTQTQQFSVYLAPRLFIKITPSFTVFAKLGLTYMQINVIVDEKKAKARFEPMTGAGMMYYITSNFSVQTQFLFFAGSEGINLFDDLTGTRLLVPNSYLFLAGLGYEFHF